MPRELHGPYQYLSKDIMYEWFNISTWEIKDKYKKYIEEDSPHFSGGDQHCPIVSEYFVLQGKIFKALKS